MEKNLALMLLCCKYYLLILSSGVVNKTLSQMCGRLYFPTFLFMMGLFTLIYIASLMVLAMLFSSLPKFGSFPLRFYGHYYFDVQKVKMVSSNVL